MNDRQPDALSRRTVLKGAVTTASAWLAACGGGDSATAEAAAVQPSAAPAPPTGGSTPAPPAVVVQPPPAPPAGPPVQAGAWQQLRFGTHSRKVIIPFIRPSVNFDPTYAEMVDAQTPQDVTAIPYRSFCRTVVGEPGFVYYNGSLHTNYQGNEIDRLDLRDLTSTTVPVAINHQPRVPPQGPESGYGGGSGNYVYAMYGTPLADPAMWQPYAHHTWTKNGWHPTWGWFSQITYATGNGTALGPNPGGQGTRYQQCNGQQGLVTYNWAEGRYHVRVTTAPGLSGASDWNPHRFSLLFLQTDGASRVSVKEVVDTETTAQDGFTFDSGTLSGNTWGFAANASGNGILVKWMEASKYLCLRMDFNRFPGDTRSFDSCHTLFLINLEDGSQKVRRLRPPAAALQGISVAEDGNVTFCIARNSRRIFWIVYRGRSGGTGGDFQFVRFYVSTFDAPEVWSEVITSGLPQIPTEGYYGSWLASNREPMWFYNGHLFLVMPEGGGPADPGYINGAVNLYRVKVDGGEISPAIRFDRFDYWAQNPATRGFRFSNTLIADKQMIGTKHVNWAYNPADSTYYQCAGDFGLSFCQSMCKMAFDGTPRGYTFTEVLSETGRAAAGKVRPSSPDDGYWFHVPADSAWVAGRGKFVYCRGGDGIGMFGNAVLATQYGVTNGAGNGQQVAAALADGWRIVEKFLLFDPAQPDGFVNLGPTIGFDAATNTFSVANYNGWTQDDGGNFMPDLWMAPAAATRCGTFDPTTGCIWRFYQSRLARFDMVNKTVRVYNISTWTSPDTGRRYTVDGAYPPSANDVVADGSKAAFGFYDTQNQRWKTHGAFEWEHKAVWLDPATGFLYVVSPGTGYLWRFDTRATQSAHVANDGWRMSFEPVGERIPFSGTYPPMDSLNTWPPVVYGGDVKMNSLLFPFKGGLLFISPGHHDHGASGEPHYVYWRRLDSTGPWSVVSMPLEFAANTGAARFAYSKDNNEILAISQAFTDIGSRQLYRYFWRIT